MWARRALFLLAGGCAGRADIPTDAVPADTDVVDTTVDPGGLDTDTVDDTVDDTDRADTDTPVGAVWHGSGAADYSEYPLSHPNFAVRCTGTVTLAIAPAVAGLSSVTGKYVCPGPYRFVAPMDGVLTVESDTITGTVHWPAIDLSWSGTVEGGAWPTRVRGEYHGPSVEMDNSQLDFTFVAERTAP